MSSLTAFADGNKRTRYVWYLGYCWLYEGIQDHKGFVSLINIRDTSLGINADPNKIRNCTIPEIEAIYYFTQENNNGRIGKEERFS